MTRFWLLVVASWTVGLGSGCSHPPQREVVAAALLREHVLSEVPARIRQVRCAPKSSRIAVMDWGGDIRVYQFRGSGCELLLHVDADLEGLAIDFDQTGHLLCVALANNTGMSVVDVRSGQVLFETGQGRYGKSFDVRVSPDGATAAVATSSFLQIVSLRDGRVLREVDGEFTSVFYVSPDSVVAGGLERGLLEVALGTGTEKSVKWISSGWLNWLSARDGQVVASFAEPTGAGSVVRFTRRAFGWRSWVLSTDKAVASAFLVGGEHVVYSMPTEDRVVLRNLVTGEEAFAIETSCPIRMDFRGGRLLVGNEEGCAAEWEIGKAPPP